MELVRDPGKIGLSGLMETEAKWGSSEAGGHDESFSFGLHFLWKGFAIEHFDLEEDPTRM